MGLSKSRRRNKWYECFKPELHEDYPLLGGKGSNINLLRKKLLMASMSDDEMSVSCFSDDEDRLSKKSKPRRSLSRSLSRSFKAVLLPIYSAKKSRSRKSDQEKSFRSSSTCSSVGSKIDRVLDSFRGKKSPAPLPAPPMCKRDSFTGSLRSDSSASSLFSPSVTPALSSASSSRTSSVASHSRSASERKKSIAIDLKQLERKPTKIYPRRNNRCCKPIIGLYFLFICLLSLVLCGKAMAVFCTSACVFWIPCCFRRANPIANHQTSSVYNNNVDGIVDVDSDEGKKKVVMGGLLEGSRITRLL